jgi:hypothetical protein
MACTMLNWSGPAGRDAGEARRRTLILVRRLVAECAPHPLERAGVGVEHDHAVIAVAVGDEQLVGRRMHPDVRRLMQIAAALSAMRGPPRTPAWRGFAPGLAPPAHLRRRSMPSETARHAGLRFIVSSPPLWLLRNKIARTDGGRRGGTTRFRAGLPRVLSCSSCRAGHCDKHRRVSSGGLAMKLVMTTHARCLLAPSARAPHSPTLPGHCSGSSAHRTRCG